MERIRTLVLIAAAATAALTSGCSADEEAVPTGAPATAASRTAEPSTSPSAGDPASSDDPWSLTAVDLTVAQGADAGAAGERALGLPQGWEAEVWASVPGARLAAWTPDGRLLVSSGDRGEVVALTPNADGQAPSQATMLEGLRNPQGLAFADDTTLVVGETDAIRSYSYADGVAADPTALIDGLPTSGHGSKAVLVDGDRVLFSLGSESNRDPADRDGDPARAVIASVPLTGGDMEVVATGVRNGFGLAEAPDGSVWTAVNQADNQPYPYDDDGGSPGEEVRDYINDNPVEQVTRIGDDTDLGWPYCVPDARDTTLNLPFVNDPQFNANGDALDCSQLAPTRVGLPSHSAPLGLTFTQGTAMEDGIGTGAIVTMHGSWNRQPPREPSLAFLAWDEEAATLGAPVPLVTGFQDEAGERWGRVVTTVIGPDGDLYVTDDAAGLVYRIGPAD